MVTLIYKPIHIIATVSQLLMRWPVMAGVVGSSPLIANDFPHFLFSFGFFTCLKLF